MLLQKIQSGALLILSALIMVCCSKTYDASFFKGEWLSDSLVTKENDHWREFLYFDDGHAARTTVWGRQYLLNKNLKVKDLQLYERDKALFRIKVIDSNKITVEGKDYYGSFRRSNYQPDEMRTAVAIAEKTESQRKKLLGQWKAINFSIVSLQDPKDTFTIHLPEHRKIAVISTDEITAVNIGYDQLSFHTNNHIRSFEYNAEPDKINFISGDVIFSLKYYFQNERLIIEYRTFRNILNSVTFEKVR